MKFVIMHKVDERMERGERPPGTLIAAMGQLIGGAKRDGQLVDGAGLHRSAQRARVRVEQGRATVERGPYAGRDELVAGFAMITAPSIDHAVDVATELAKVAAADRSEIEIGPVVEGWDLTGAPRPADAPWRFLLLIKATETSERGVPPSASVRELLERWRRDGILHTAATLAPTPADAQTGTPRAARSRVDGGKRSWVDGPFAESKELIAGYAILELASLDEARAFADRYAAILGDNEVDVRIVDDPR